jgi:hypothetical protein
MQSGNQAKKENEPPHVPEWVDMCKQLAEIEEMIYKLKQQIMRSATKMRGI